MGKFVKNIRGLAKSLLGRYIYASLKRKSRKTDSQEEVVVSFPGIRSPIFLRLNTSDLETFKDIFVKGQYDFMPEEAPGVIVDGGANIGLTSLVFANRFPETKIIAVEPEASNYEVLRKNTASYVNILPVRAAIWDRNCVVDIVDPGLGKWGFQVGAEDGSSGQSVMRCTAITIDKLMDDHDIEYIDILKMDIEGGEKEVFADAAKWIDRVGLLSVELHDRLKEGCSLSLENATVNFKYRWRQGENVYCSHRRVV